MEIQVRDNKNFIIGTCVDNGNTIRATHIRKGYAGVYYKSTNMTMDRFGKLYCYGDGTKSLIRDKERN